MIDPNAEIEIPFVDENGPVSVTLWKCVYNWFLDEYDSDAAHRMTDAVFDKIKKGASTNGR
ncbi:hypothetical protein [Massilia sp. ZL223]|uniref:hypothetical protein n=1 Tax=Massilia sp. ZL223 TaxID=2824904 RepID=UPI001B81EFBA|nr:hypothetical protein [Massilia sp. ZL223]MBQ5963189.1 hypothetical protein [Massilia sp. ZL223]